jgi:hypothetical protein
MGWNGMKSNEQTLFREKGTCPLIYLSKNRTCLQNHHVGSSGHELDSHFKSLGKNARDRPDQSEAKNQSNW